MAEWFRVLDLKSRGLDLFSEVPSSTPRSHYVNTSWDSSQV